MERSSVMLASRMTYKPVLTVPAGYTVIAHFATDEMELLVADRSNAGKFIVVLSASCAQQQSFMFPLTEYTEPPTAERIMNDIVAVSRQFLCEQAVRERSELDRRYRYAVRN